MPECDVRPALTTPGLTLPTFGDRSPSTMRPLLPKFGQLPPVTSFMLTTSRDRPPSMSETHVVMMDRGHLSSSTPVRPTLTKLPVRLLSMLMLVVAFCTMRTSNAGEPTLLILFVVYTVFRDTYCTLQYFFFYFCNEFYFKQTGREHNAGSIL